MLVHWNSYFNVANMENEVYSERSKSMHSLCSIFFSADSSDQYTFYSYSAIFQQTLIELLIVNMQRMNGGEKKSTGRNSRGKR